MTELEQKIIFSKNLNFYINKNNLKQLEIAKSIGVSPQTFNTWVKGIAIPRMGKIQKLADYFGIYKSDLLEEKITSTDDFSDVTNLIHPSAYRIPIIGNICAGDGCTVIEEKIGYFTVDNSIKADFALVVKGDSMIDIDINDGDIVLIKKVYDYFDGKIYAIRLIDEDEATIKKCFFEENKVIMQPCNPEYKPMIADGENVAVVGECVGVYHTL